jgi:nucleoside-diphosphate-sugar epimerase
MLGKTFAKTRKCTFINIRLEHMFGPGDGPSKFVTSVFQKMLDDVPEIKLTLGEQCRDFIYIDDVVDAYLRIIESINKIEHKRFWCFEAGRGTAISIREFITKAHGIIGSKSKLLFGALPYRENEIMYSKANVQKLEKMGWQCKVNLESGIQSVITSMK